MKKTLFILVFLIACADSFAQTDSCYVLEITKKNGKKVKCYAWTGTRMIHFQNSDTWLYFSDIKERPFMYDRILEISSDSIWVTKDNEYLGGEWKEQYKNLRVGYPISDIQYVDLGQMRSGTPKRYIFRAIKIAPPCYWDASPEMREYFKKLIGAD